MAIKYVTGDATRPEGDAPKIIAHVCNNQGGWGAGFVVAISRRWRTPEKAYREWHFKGKDPEAGTFTLGQVQFVEVEPKVWVANMIAQVGYGRGTDPHRAPGDTSVPLRYESLRACLMKVSKLARFHGAGVHMPRIGCGLAGGRWEKVEPVIHETLTDIYVPVTVYDLPGTRWT